MFVGHPQARELWIPNPLTAQMKFYNKVLSELYEAAFDLLAPLQFKNYVLEQRIARWRINEECKSLEDSFQNFFNRESKDGNAINVQKFMSELANFKTGDKARVLSAQGVVEKFLFREAEVNKKVSEKRALLFNKVNDVKAWKSNELNFYDQRLDQLKILRMKLERCQTKIITYVDMLSKKVSENADLEENSKRKQKRSNENARKAVARKERRLLSKVCETTKILEDLGIHVMALNETELDLEYPRELTIIPGYEHKKRERTCRGGGVSVFIRDSVKYTRR